MQLPYRILKRLPSRHQLWMHKRRLRRELKKAAKGGTLKHPDSLELDRWELADWEQQLEDERLIKQAQKLDIFLTDFPAPPKEDHYDQGYWRSGHFGFTILHSQIRNSLRNEVRTRRPIAREELRKNWALAIQAVSALTGLGGIVVAGLALYLK